MPSLVSLYLHTHPKDSIPLFKLPHHTSVSLDPCWGRWGQGSAEPWTWNLLGES